MSGSSRRRAPTWKRPWPRTASARTSTTGSPPSRSGCRRCESAAGTFCSSPARFLARACGDYGRPQKTLTPDAQAAIAGYRWPGNVRELANVMERVALMTDASVVDPADLALQGAPERPAAANGDAPAAISGFTDSLDRFERAQLIAALDVTGWNVVQAAQQLGIPRTTLRHRMAKYRLARGGVTLLRPRAAPTPAATHKLPSPPPAVVREERTVALLQASLERIAPAAMEILIEKIEGSAASSWRSPPPASWPPSGSRRSRTPQAAPRAPHSPCGMPSRRASGIARHGRPLPPARVIALHAGTCPH